MFSHTVRELSFHIGYEQKNLVTEDIKLDNIRENKTKFLRLTEKRTKKKKTLTSRSISTGMFYFL